VSHFTPNVQHSGGMMLRARISSMLIALAICGVACATHRSAAATPDRIVAIGDLHGDLDNALATLRLAGIVDDSGKWAAGSTTLVQTGDVTDRGPDSKAILDLLQRLKAEAKNAGGRVVPLLGNHEVMNMQGDNRYVHPGDYTSFGGADARAQAFDVDGPYGSRLAKQDIVAKVGDAIFTHGGVHPTFASMGVDGINDAWHAALRGGDAAVIGNAGPLWYRGFVQDPEPAACALLAESLDKLGAKRMVVGHTTRRNGKIESRCGGALQVIDTGISDHYGGNLAAWEWSNGDARAIYPSGPVDLEDPP